MDLSVQGSAGNLGYAILTDQAIKPMYDSMPVYDQLTGIADKLGVKEMFTEGRTQEGLDPLAGRQVPQDRPRPAHL